MTSATGDHKKSIRADKFNLPLPSEALDYHVFKRGDINRLPLLSVGKVCQRYQMYLYLLVLVFSSATCDFYKDDQLLLTGYRDPATTGLYLLPKPKVHNDLSLLPKSRTTLPPITDDLNLFYAAEAFSQKKLPF